MDYMDAYNVLQANIAQNNAWSAEQAQKQMDFQERMANTAHQREVQDLKAAGLNPILSAHTNGASTPSGAMAQESQGSINAIADLLNKMIDSQTAIGVANAKAIGNAYGNYGNTGAAKPNIPASLGKGNGSYTFDGRGAAAAAGDFTYGLTGRTERELMYELGDMMRNAADVDKKKTAATGFYMVGPNGHPVNIGGIQPLTKEGVEAQANFFRKIGNAINNVANRIAGTAYNATHATDHKKGYWIDDKGRMYDSYRVGTHYVER